MTPCCHNSWLFETKIKKMKMKKLWQSGLTWAEAQDQVNNEQPTTRSGGKYCDTAVMWLYLIRWYNVSSHCSWNCNQWVHRIEPSLIKKKRKKLIMTLSTLCVIQRSRWQLCVWILRAPPTAVFPVTSSKYWIEMMTNDFVKSLPQWYLVLLSGPGGLSESLKPPLGF